MNAIEVTEYQDKLVALLREVEARGVKHLFCNGAGSKLTVLKYIRPPADIRELFEFAADLHDLAYWVGGEAKHKAQADAFFFAICLSSAYDVDGFFARVRVRYWAQLCQLAVRVGGEASFEWRQEPCWNLDELIKEAIR